MSVATVGFLNVADSDGRPLLRTVYFTNGDWETRAFWTMVVLYIYFILKELVEMQSLGLKLYFSELWNIYELVDLYCLYKAFDTMGSFQDISTQVEGELLRSENELVYYDVMASGGDTTAACKRLVAGLRFHTDGWRCAAGVRSMYRDVKKWMALNAFTAVLKIFKYLKLSSRMNSLWEVLERALSDMLAFMLILFFIMAGFGVFGVSCHAIAAIWVAFFARSQQDRC